MGYRLHESTASADDVFTTAINSVFAFLIAGAIVFSRHGMTNELLLNLIFYIIITPVIGTTLTKLMFMSENNILVADAIARMDEILNEAPLSESEAPKQPKDNSIEFADVCYSYDGEKQALDHISLSVRSGEKIALVGPSGGGKSTLAALVSRFFDPQSGSVRIGGVDIRDISQAELMKEISFVFQNSHLIKMSRWRARGRSARKSWRRCGRHSVRIFWKKCRRARTL